MKFVILKGIMVLNRMLHKPSLAVTILLMAFIASAFSTVYGFQETPSIEVYQPASSDPVIKVYWNYTLPSGCRKDDVETLFQALMEMQVLLKKSIYRFISEHPNEFDELALLRFENVSNPEEAEVIYGVYLLPEGEVGGEVQIVTPIGTEPWKLFLDCKLTRMPLSLRLRVVMHELMHTLGLGHVHEHGSGFEVMLANAKNVEEYGYYPSTLDLYAIYQTMFKKNRERIVTLPEWMEWEPIKPYDEELQELQQKLKDDETKISLLGERIDILIDDIRKIKRERDSLRSNISAFQERIKALETAKSYLNQSLSKALETIKSQGQEIQTLQASLSRAEAEKQVLKRRLQQANQIILALAILVVSLTAVAVITFRRGGGLKSTPVFDNYDLFHLPPQV